MVKLQADCDIESTLPDRASEDSGTESDESNIDGDSDGSLSLDSDREMQHGQSGGNQSQFMLLLQWL